MKLKQIFKGVLNIVVGVLFFQLRFYTIQQTVLTADGHTFSFIELVKQGVDYGGQYFTEYFNDIFKQNGINLVLALLFIGIGVLELLQIKGMKSNVN